jgi:hypothetical protein
MTAPKTVVLPLHHEPNYFVIASANVIYILFSANNFLIIFKKK